MVKIFCFILLASSLTFAQSLPDQQFSLMNFQLGAAVLYQSSDKYTVTPAVAFTPDYRFNQQISFSPRAEILFNRNKITDKIDPIYLVGLNASISVLQSYYFSPEIFLAAISNDGSSQNVSGYGLGVGYKAQFLYFDRLSLAYRKYNSDIETNQITLSVGVNLNEK